MPSRVGLFGGSFDPVHHGHLIIARAVAERLRLDRVLLLPSSSPPHKLNHVLADAIHRAEMIRLAIAGERIFELSDFDLTRPGLTYTVDTVRHFRNALGPDAYLCWIIGADSLAELTTWREVETILGLCDVVTAHRPGFEHLDWQPIRERFGPDRADHLRAGVVETPRIDISSTDIRERVSKSLAIRYLSPDPVADYIATHRLYRNSQSDRPTSANARE